MQLIPWMPTRAEVMPHHFIGRKAERAGGGVGDAQKNRATTDAELLQQTDLESDLIQKEPIGNWIN